MLEVGEILHVGKARHLEVQLQPQPNKKHVRERSWPLASDQDVRTKYHPSSRATEAECSSTDWDI